MPRLVVAIVGFALVVAACSSGGESASLTIYSGRSEDLVAPLIEEFEAASGVDVEVRYAGSAELAATILEEGDRSPADVFFAQDPASLGTVALAGLFAGLPGEITDLVPGRFSDTTGRWVGTSGRARTFVYDTAEIDVTDLPDTEDELVDDQWRGRVGIAPTNGSFLAFVAAKILIDGEQATLEWLRGMEANQSPTFPKNSAIVTAVADAQVESGLVNHYYLLRHLAEDPAAKAANHFFPVATAGSLVMPAGVGILESTRNAESAREFVRFLLSRGAQEYFASETFEYPVLEGVAANSVLPPLASLAAPDLDLSELATVLDRATDLVAEAGLL